MISRVIVAVLLPIACVWARAREAEILRDGVVLVGVQLACARRAGVKHPERVRVLAVERIPMLLSPLLRHAAERFGLVSPHTAGMTLRYGIYLRADCVNDHRLLMHELTHVKQYERLGGIRKFLRVYLRECITPGYPRSALEREAQAMEWR